MEAAPNPPKSSPLLPWEVIERIISLSDDPYGSIAKSFSLTCRTLRPRSLCLLVADVALHNRDKIFRFCDFLQAKPHLKPLVRSISVDPEDFAPVPLLQLRMLPNLSRIQFASSRSLSDRFVVLNQSSVLCSQLLGAHIQTLSLHHLHFKTCLHFFRALSMFPKIVHLVCGNIVIDADDTPTKSLELAKQRLSQKLHILTLEVGYSLLDDQKYNHDITPSVGTCLIDSGLVQCTVEDLIVYGVSNAHVGLSRPFDWPRLRSLTLSIRWKPEEIIPGIVFLKGFHHLALQLKVVTVEVLEHPTVPAIKRHTDLCPELEKTLLRFPQGRLTWSKAGPCAAINSFSIQELGKHFPALKQRVCHFLCTAPPRRDSITILAVSPDSKWAASGDRNGVLTVPKLQSPEKARSSSSLYHMVKNWDAHTGVELLSLEGHKDAVWMACFSPCGTYVASVSADHTVRLWRTDDGSCVATLSDDNYWVSLVAFSPDGKALAAGDLYGTVSIRYMRDILPMDEPNS